MTSRRPNNVISFRSGLPVRVDRRRLPVRDTSILQVGTAIAVYCRFMHRYMSPSRPPCSMRLLAVGSISVVGRAQPVVAYEVIGRNR